MSGLIDADSLAFATGLEFQAGIGSAGLIVDAINPPGDASVMTTESGALMLSESGAVMITEAASRVTLASAAIAAAYNPSVPPDFIQTLGYATAGDGGDALYQRVAAQPSHPAKFQIAQGSWYELYGNSATLEVFGGVGDGATDNDNAFIGRQLWHRAKLAADPSAWLTHQFLAGRTYKCTSSLYPFFGLDKLIVRGNDAVLDCGYYGYGGYAMINGHPSWNALDNIVGAGNWAPNYADDWRIQTASVGDDHVTTLVPASAGNFSAGDWAMVHSGTEGSGNFPPTCTRYEYVQVASSNASTGVITFAPGTQLQYAYLSTLPPHPYPDASGAWDVRASIFKVSPFWDVEQVIYDLHGSASTTSISVCGRSVRVVRGSGGGLYASMLGTGSAEDYEDKANGTTAIVEVDWMVGDWTYRNCRYARGIRVTAPSARMTFDNCAIGGDSIVGGLEYTASNTTFAGNLNMRGKIGAASFTNCACAGTIEHEGSLSAQAPHIIIDGTTITYSPTGGADGNGRITIPKTAYEADYNFFWFVYLTYDGARVYVVSGNYYQPTGATITLVGVTGDASNVYLDIVPTTIPDGTVLRAGEIGSYAGVGNTGSLINGDLAALLADH